jgi:hypothetical protein
VEAATYWSAKLNSLRASGPMRLKLVRCSPNELVVDVAVTGRIGAEGGGVLYIFKMRAHGTAGITVLDAVRYVM